MVQQEAMHRWKNLPDPLDWTPGVLDKLSDPNQRVLFNLDGVDVRPGVTRAASGRGGASMADSKREMI